MPHVRPSIADKRRAFHKLHETGCFVIPNPWDVGSARFLQGLGFKALATTSSGFAWSHGHRDGGMSRDRVLDHLTDMVEATDLPINADFENGFAPDAAGVAESVRLAVESGVAGLSIEDSTGDASQPLYELDTAVERIRAARKAIDKAGGDTLLVGRAECFLVRAARYRTHHPAAQGLCKRGRRLPLCTGHPHARAHQRGGRRRGAQTGEPAHGLGGRPYACSRSPRSACAA